MARVWQPASGRGTIPSPMEKPPQHGDVVSLDPRVRTAALVVTVAALVVGLFLIGFLRNYIAGLEELMDRDPDEAARRIAAALRVLTWMIAIPPIAAALVLANVAMRAWRSGRYPPPGARPVRAVRVRTGHAARRIAVLAAGVAALLVVATVILVATLRRIETWLGTSAAL